MIKMKSLIQENRSKVQRIFLDLDGVLCNFDLQYRKYLSNDRVWNIILNSKKTVSQKKLDAMGIDRQEFNKKLTAIRNEALKAPSDTFSPFKEKARSQLNISVAWSVIGIGGEEYWSDMEWQPGGKKLVGYVRATNIPLQILTAGQGSSAKNGKTAWCKRNGLGDIPFNIVNSGIQKHEFANDGDLLIDDKHENNELFIQSGGMAITHTNVDKTIQQMKQQYGITVGL